MTRPIHTTAALHAAMHRLIDRATNFDVDALQTIYHKDFHTTMVMPDSTVTTYDKEEFIAHFRKRRKKARHGSIRGQTGMTSMSWATLRFVC